MRNRRDVHIGNAPAISQPTTSEVASVRQRPSSSNIAVASNIPSHPNPNAQRDKRDAPECVVNYKAQRQLLFGCSQPDIVEVRPKCNDDGDEGIYPTFINHYCNIPPGIIWYFVFMHE